MLKVFFTVDVEVWCDGWDNLDRAFPSAFQRYVYGPTAGGNCALRLTLRVLSDHGLSGVFLPNLYLPRASGSHRFRKSSGYCGSGAESATAFAHQMGE